MEAMEGYVLRQYRERLRYDAEAAEAHRVEMHLKTMNARDTAQAHPDDGVAEEHYRQVAQDHGKAIATARALQRELDKFTELLVALALYQI